MDDTIEIEHYPNLSINSSLESIEDGLEGGTKRTSQDVPDFEDEECTVVTRVTNKGSFREYIKNGSIIKDSLQIHGVCLNGEFSLHMLCELLGHCSNIRHFSVSQRASLVSNPELSSPAVNTTAFPSYINCWKLIRRNSVITAHPVIESLKKPINNDVTTGEKEIHLNNLKDFTFVLNKPTDANLAMNTAIAVLKNLKCSSLVRFSFQVWTDECITPGEFAMMLECLVNFLQTHSSTMKFLCLKFSQSCFSKWRKLLSKLPLFAHGSDEVETPSKCDQLSAVVENLKLDSFTLDVVDMRVYPDGGNWLHFLTHFVTLKQLNLFLQGEESLLINTHMILFNVKATLTVCRIWINLRERFNFTFVKQCENLKEFFFCNDLLAEESCGENIQSLPPTLESLALINMIFSTVDILKMVQRQRQLDTLVLMNLPTSDIKSVGVDEECVKEILSMRRLQSCLLTNFQDQKSQDFCFKTVCRLDSRDNIFTGRYGTLYPPCFNIVSWESKNRYHWIKSIRKSYWYNCDIYDIRVESDFRRQT